MTKQNSLELTEDAIIRDFFKWVARKIASRQIQIVRELGYFGENVEIIHLDNGERLCTIDGKDAVIFGQIEIEIGEEQEDGSAVCEICLSYEDIGKMAEEFS